MIVTRFFDGISKGVGGGDLINDVRSFTWFLLHVDM